MNREELLIQAGQRFVSGFEGKELPSDFIEDVKRSKIGNVILFSKNISSLSQLRELCISIDEIITKETGYHPFITIDQEGGMVSRLPEGVPIIPSQMALAALGSPSLAEVCAHLNGSMLRFLGCSINLAPVLDVNSNVKNPVIGVRSFSDKSGIVSEFGATTVYGYKSANIICCGKHFPGHGDTSVDSHLDLPLIDKSLRELTAALEPFRVAIKAKIPAIMTSHILFPKIESERIPATMSYKIVHDLLRRELGFNGLVLSDCMEMNAIKTYYGTVPGSLEALASTVDLVFISHHSAIAREAIEAALERYSSGGFDEEEWKCSINRIKKAKKDLTPISKQAIPTYDNSIQLFNEVAERSITKVKAKARRCKSGDIFIGVEPYITSNISDKLEREVFPTFLSNKFKETKGFVISASPDKDEIDNLLSSLSECDKNATIYFGSYNAHLQAGQLDAIRAIAKAGYSIDLFALRNPYDLTKEVLSLVNSATVTYEYSSRILNSIASILNGDDKSMGKLPISLEE